MKLNIKTLREFYPCHDPTKYFSEDWEGTVQEILKDERIPESDRIWLFSKAAPKNKCREFACWCALQVIDKWDAPDVVREYLETGDEEIRSAAWSVAWDAVKRSAARSPELYAVKRSAAWAAAKNSAAWNAAWFAAQSASDRYAVGDAWKAQLQKALELVNQ